MNKRFIIVFAVLGMLLGVSSCQQDMLDRLPLDSPSNGNFFSNESELLLGINGAYVGLWWHHRSTPYQLWLDAATDLAYSRADYGGMLSVQSGQFTTETGVFREVWAHMYKYIARCNNLLENMHRAAGAVSPDFHNRIAAEARFLRAYYYTYLVSLYGDVPFITTMLDVDAVNEVRTPSQAIIASLYEDLEFAAAHLPDAWTGSDVGRATKGAAWGIKSRLALYHGDYRTAADAAKQVVDLNVYRLVGDYQRLFSYSGMGSSEVILDLPYAAGLRFNDIPQMLGMRGGSGWAILVPTQRMVDIYQASDGLSIDDSPMYNPERPFENRDPRLDQSIIRPGVWFDGLLFETHPDSTRTWRDIGGTLTRVENLEVTNAFATFTGYHWRKYHDESDVPGKVTQSELHVMLLRYAEVLLTYAEAKIELNEIDASVIAAINAVRQRASVNMPAAVGNDREALRQLVRYERTVELALEGSRLFDLRRWRYAEHVMPGNVLGRRLKDAWYKPVVPQIGAYQDPVYGDEKSVFQVIGVNVFDPAKHYLWPIPQRERDLNAKLTQNDNY